MELKVKLRIRGDVMMVYCQGPIAADDVETLSRRISALLPERRRIVLQVENAELAREDLLHLLIQYLWARSRGCQIKLSNVPPCFAAPLRESHLESVFEIYPTEEEAMASFNRDSREMCVRDARPLARNLPARMDFSPGNRREV